MKYERNYGIDLLRLVLMYMVCMLHTLGQGGILGVCQAGTVEYKAFWFLEISGEILSGNYRSNNSFSKGKGTASG